MKVILTQDVEKLGASHEVVEVADGFARNYLLPRSLAMAATKSALANLDNLKRQEDRRQEKLRGAASEQATKLENQTLIFSDANVGSKGRLYGSIGNADIAEALKKQFGVEVDRRTIELPETIRSEGFYTLPIKLHRDVTVPIRIQVGNPTVEAAPAEAAPAEAAV